MVTAANEGMGRDWEAVGMVCQFASLPIPRPVRFAQLGRSVTNGAWEAGGRVQAAR